VAAFPRLWQRLILILCNLLPLLHAAGLVLLAALPWAAPGRRLAAVLVLLYLVPPVLGRLLLRVIPLPQGRIPVASRAFFAWWALSNLQMLFNRLPFLEEPLRLVPGLYGAWLRLWGARVGHFTYWTAGLQILDRSLVAIGSGVVFGAGVRLVSHVYLKNPDGVMELALGTIVIGDGAQVGGYSLLSAGTVIGPGEITRACLLAPPFSVWADGRRSGRIADAH